jgi:hypothetical protein
MTIVEIAPSLVLAKDLLSGEFAELFGHYLAASRQSRDKISAFRPTPIRWMAPAPGVDAAKCGFS